MVYYCERTYIHTLYTIYKGYFIAKLLAFLRYIYVDVANNNNNNHNNNYNVCTSVCTYLLKFELLFASNL